MASGHVNRTNRPNTWLHRPSLRREKSPCQLGAVHTWHLSDLGTHLTFGRHSAPKRTLSSRKTAGRRGKAGLCRRDGPEATRLLSANAKGGLCNGSTRQDFA